MFANKKTPDELLDELIKRYPVLNECVGGIKDAYEALRTCFAADKTLWCAGNGGSAADCDHICGELMKSFMFKRPLCGEFSDRLTDMYGDSGSKLCGRLEGGLRAISLPSLTALSTAITNDMGGDLIFAQMVTAAVSRGDVFLGISTSGNSPNIVNAAMAARAKGAAVIVLTGKNECRLDEICTVAIHVPETETYKIQELHLPVYHALCAMTEAEFFGK